MVLGQNLSKFNQRFFDKFCKFFDLDPEMALQPDTTIRFAKLRRGAYPYQLYAALWQLCRHKSEDPLVPAVLNCDEVGTGKTMTSLLMVYINALCVVDSAWKDKAQKIGFAPVQGHVLIITPPAVIISWFDEITATLPVSAENNRLTRQHSGGRFNVVVCYKAPNRETKDRCVKDGATWNHDCSRNTARHLYDIVSMKTDDDGLGIHDRPHRAFDIFLTSTGAIKTRYRPLGLRPDAKLVERRHLNSEKLSTGLVLVDEFHTNKGIDTNLNIFLGTLWPSRPFFSFISATPIDRTLEDLAGIMLVAAGGKMFYDRKSAEVSTYDEWKDDCRQAFGCLHPTELRKNGKRLNNLLSRTTGGGALTEEEISEKARILSAFKSAFASITIRRDISSRWGEGPTLMKPRLQVYDITATAPLSGPWMTAFESVINKANRDWEADLQKRRDKFYIAKDKAERAGKRFEGEVPSMPSKAAFSRAETRMIKIMSLVPNAAIVLDDHDNLVRANEWRAELAIGIGQESESHWLWREIRDSVFMASPKLQLLASVVNQIQAKRTVGKVPGNRLKLLVFASHAPLAAIANLVSSYTVIICVSNIPY